METSDRSTKLLAVILQDIILWDATAGGNWVKGAQGLSVVYIYFCDHLRTKTFH